MPEIRNFTMNFSSGRPAGLTRKGESAFAETHLEIAILHGALPHA